MIVVAFVVVIVSWAWMRRTPSTRTVGTQTLDDGIEEVHTYVTQFGQKLHSKESCPTLAKSFPIKVNGRPWCNICSSDVGYKLVTKDATQVEESRIKR